MKKPPTLADWIAHVFDHPVERNFWNWSLDAPAWKGSEEETVAFIAETFEQAGELLARFSDAQLNQGFWYLVSGSGSDFMFSLVEPRVPLEARLRALRSFLPLFKQVMAVRCAPHLSHLDEQPANPLNSACYMWWDILPIYGRPDLPERAAVDAEVLRLLPCLLSIPHDACRESALHGIGHWQPYYPALATVVDDFLERTQGLPSGACRVCAGCQGGRRAVRSMGPKPRSIPMAEGGSQNGSRKRISGSESEWEDRARLRGIL